ncbi:MAG: DUF3795 domain-containing protein [Candidatus Hodarchaeota archaeon]
MNDATSLCGFDCGICPAFKEFDCGICPAFKDNLKSDDDRIKVDEGWKKFHKTRGWIYKEHSCNGCFNIPDVSPLWSTCFIRKCVLINNVKNCGYCLDYPCPRIQNMIRVINKIAERTRKSGIQEDFQLFALPHLNETRLDEIHNQFIKTVAKSDFIPVNPFTVSFPSVLDLKILSGIDISQKGILEALQNLHSIIESMLMLHCKTPGGQEQEIKRKKENSKFLWIVGRHGRLLTDNEELSIEISKEGIKKYLKYGKNKTKRKLQELTDHGIEGDYLKDKVQIKFINKQETAIIIQKYIQTLLDNNSERIAYSKFWKGDMTIFRK